ncbi:MAG: type II secretion system F family protein [Desertimonas sp.]
MTDIAPIVLAMLAVTVTGLGTRSVVTRQARTIELAGPTAGLRRRRTPPPDETAMAEWCEQAARSLRTGVSLTRALQEAARAAPRARPAFAPSLARLERGHGLADAIADLDDDPATPSGLVASVLGACAALGGPAARPLDRTAAVLHARAAERAERLVASAQARLSARVLTVLPLATLGLMVIAEPSTREAVATPAGIACVLAGGGFNLAGWWWMRRVIRQAA